MIGIFNSNNFQPNFFNSFFKGFLSHALLPLMEVKKFITNGNQDLFQNNFLSETPLCIL